VLGTGNDRGGLRVGLPDGRVMPLSSSVRRGINLYDVVFVKLTDARNKQAARVELRVRPVVQGAALILDNKTGGILAMAGGFSYPLSQLNRTTQSWPSRWSRRQRAAARPHGQRTLPRPRG
jgi:penicillin-binding protein 1A